MGVKNAFTLIEMLTVIAIIGILTAITIPNLGSFKPNVMAGASRQLLDDVARARQLAISQRTTVYMIFVPPGFWNDPAYAALPAAEKEKAMNVLDKQTIGYTFVTLRRLGDQPGVFAPHYVSAWRTLPEGVFIVPQKFGIGDTNVFVWSSRGQSLQFAPFPRTRDNPVVNVPFPSPDGGYLNVPYMAFNYLGQLESGKNEVIPLALGSVGFSRDAQRRVRMTAVSPEEKPAGNSTNSFNIVHVDWLTGRARLERQEIQ